MDRVFADFTKVEHAPIKVPNPVDQAYNVAVRHIAGICNPNGWDEFSTFAEAPTTLAELTAYANEHGRLGIATEDSDGTIFDCADTNVHLRAWHDSVHLRHQLGFTVAGEAAAVYVQVAQVYHLYGFNEQTVRWAQLLLADILGLVINFKKTGRYPMNKRNGCVNEAKRWKYVAEQIWRYAQGKYHESGALAYAKSEWGCYKEVV